MITEKDIAQAFNDAGIDTPEKLADAVNGFTTNLAIKQIDVQIDALAKKRQEALAPIQNEQTALLNARSALTDKIIPKG